MFFGVLKLLLARFRILIRCFEDSRRDARRRFASVVILALLGSFAM
jgi:hypothetical protein